MPTLSSTMENASTVAIAVSSVQKADLPCGITTSKGARLLKMVGIRTGPVQSRWTTLATTTIIMMMVMMLLLVILVAVHVRTMQPVRTMNSCGRQLIFSWSNTCREQGSSFRKKLLLGCQTCCLAFLATVSMRGWFVSLLVITGLHRLAAATASSDSAPAHQLA